MARLIFIETVKRFFQSLKQEILSLRRKRPTVIRSIRFKDRFGVEVSIEVGTPLTFSDEENAEQHTVESITVNENNVAVHTGKYVNHFEGAEICNILFEDVDETEWVRQRLIKILERAKQLELLNPADVNHQLKSLKGK